MLLWEDFLIKGFDRTGFAGWTCALCTHFYTKSNRLSFACLHYRMVWNDVWGCGLRSRWLRIDCCVWLLWTLERICKCDGRLAVFAIVVSVRSTEFRGLFSMVSEGLCCVSRLTYMLLPVVSLLSVLVFFFFINFVSSAKQLLPVNGTKCPWLLDHDVVVLPSMFRFCSADGRKTALLRVILRLEWPITTACFKNACSITNSGELVYTSADCFYWLKTKWRKIKIWM